MPECARLGGSHQDLRLQTQDAIPQARGQGIREIFMKMAE